MWTFPGLPADLAALRQQAQVQRCLPERFQPPGAGALDQLLRALRDGFGGLLALPFDVARAQHAAAVHSGALPRSLLESARFERQLVALERLALGPLARGV